MKSLLKSVGKFFPLMLAAGGMAVLSGCKSSPPPNEPAPSVQVREQLQEEISLKADRESLETLRKEIPEQKRQANDELALILQLMGEVKLHPSEVASRFQAATQKRRAAFRAKANRLREDFRKTEARRKSDFLRAQKQERENFKDSSSDRQEISRFHADQSRKSQDFFADERDRRKDFESEIATQSKDFDFYMREKQKEFQEQHRIYTQRFQKSTP